MSDLEQLAEAYLGLPRELLVQRILRLEIERQAANERVGELTRELEWERRKR